MKKIFTLICAFSILLVGFPIINKTFAVPAYPHPVQFTQPDGTVITIQLKGDEKVNWAETLDGYTILVTKEGEYQYAILNEEGDLIFSGVKVSATESRAKVENDFLQSLSKGLFFSKEQVETLKSVWDLKDKNIKSFPTTGSPKLICILMQTPDKPFVKSQSEFDALFNQLNYTLGGATGSVRDYYLENSYGQLDLIVDVFGPYTASQNMSYYANDARPLVTEGVQMANAEANFADYDNTNNGWVDGVYMIFAGYGQEAGGGPGTIWSHAWAINPIQLDGKWISRYACSPELRGNSGTNITRIGVVGHEFGHVIGAPDYYDTDYETGGQFTGTGQWDMMAGGSWNNGGATPAHHNAFTKVVYYNWATATVLNSPTSVILENSAENQTSFYRINTTTTNEYFIIENREQHLFDSNIPGSGMIIYHVHSGVFNVGNSINATHPQRMYPVAQNATMDPTSVPSSYGTINAASCAWTGLGGSKTAFTDTSLPSSKSWAGNNTEKPITNILRNNSAKTVSFDFMGGGTPPNVVTFNVSDQADNPVVDAKITVNLDQDKESFKTNTKLSILSLTNNNHNNSLSAAKTDEEATPSFDRNTKENGSWLQYDSDNSNNSIGLNGDGPVEWIGSIMFPASVISAYEDHTITKVRTYINDMPIAAGVIIFQGEQGSLDEIYFQPINNLTAESWIDVELDVPVMFDVNQKLWIGIWLQEGGDNIFPLGVDGETDADGFGNLASWDVGNWAEWNVLSSYGISGVWNIRAYVKQPETITLYTDSNGQASFEAMLTDYTYEAEKVGYSTENGSFTVAEEETTVNIVMFNYNLDIPTVTTSTVSDISYTTAIVGGNVTSDGGSEVTSRGVVYGINTDPTTSDNTVESGSGTGSFSENLTGLDPSKIYYVRAYAINSEGTAYGNEVSFTTLSTELPAVSTSTITNISATNATAGGNVTSDGGLAITDRGVVYSTNANPDLSDVVVTSGLGIGSFSANLTNLNPETTYYVRAYATNNEGTAYGNQVSFTTLQETILFTLTLEAMPAAGGTVSGGGEYEEGENISLTASANSDYEFGAWENPQGNVVSSQPNFTYTMPAHNITLTALFNTTTDIDSGVLANVVIFPNPFTDIITIKNAQNLSRISLVNLIGQTVIDRELNGNNTATIITDMLPKGIYMIKLFDNQGKSTVRKLVK